MENIQLIEINKIQVQEKFTNRDKDKDFSTSLLSLEQSIRENGLIIPIIVREKTNGFYELFAGTRRLAVFQSLVYENNLYQSIEAIVMPASTSDITMATIKVLENKKRKKLSKIEEIEEMLSSIPVFFPNCSRDNYTDNLYMGFWILKFWYQYTRSKFKNKESLENLIELTKCQNPEDRLRNFFKMIGENERTFYDNASVYMNSPKEVLKLVHKRKISFTRAKQLNRMKSESDKQKLIEQIENDKFERDKDIKAYIDESNLNDNPDLWFRNTVKNFTDLSNLLRTNKNLSLQEKKDIDTHINLLHRLLLQNENSHVEDSIG